MCSFCGVMSGDECSHASFCDDLHLEWGQILWKSNVASLSVFGTLDRSNFVKIIHPFLSYRYEVIENDLLGSLQLTTHHIAPYKTGGAERASEIVEVTPSERASQKVVPLQHDEDSESRSKLACPPVANGESGVDSYIDRLGFHGIWYAVQREVFATRVWLPTCFWSNLQFFLVFVIFRKT